MSSFLSRRTFLRLGGLGLGSAVLAACAPTVPPTNINDPEPSGPSQDTPVLTETIFVPSPTPEPTLTQAPPVDRPFAASDPQSVALAAGRPQLVEFFAFW